MKCPQCGKEMRDVIGQVRWLCSCGCSVCTNVQMQAPMTPEQVIEQTLIKNGAALETIVAIEELSELIKELTKDWRGMGNLKHLAEEMADVEICLTMLKMIYCNAEGVAEWKEERLRRLEERLREE